MADQQIKVSDAPTSEALLAELAQVLTKSPADFQSHFPNYFLIRTPKSALSSGAQKDAEPSFEYRTTSLQVSGDGLHPWQWWVTTIAKRKGAAFPNRLAIGRADSCDIQVRFRFVSKLHARIHLEDGVPTSIEDCGSSNGTFINGQKLTPGQPLKVRSGDRIGFGSLTLELLSPAACLSAVRARQGLLPAHLSSAETLADDTEPG